MRQGSGPVVDSPPLPPPRFTFPPSGSGGNVPELALHSEQIPVHSTPAFHHLNSPTTTDPRPRATQWYVDYTRKDEVPLTDLRVSNVSSTIVLSAQSPYDHKPSSSLRSQCSLPNLTTPNPVNPSPLALFPRFPRQWRGLLVPTPTLAFVDLNGFDAGLSLGAPSSTFLCVLGHLPSDQLSLSCGISLPTSTHL
jgi:hypothetical protein